MSNYRFLHFKFDLRKTTHQTVQDKILKKEGTANLLYETEKEVVPTKRSKINHETEKC